MISLEAVISSTMRSIVNWIPVVSAIDPATVGIMNLLTKNAAITWIIVATVQLMGARIVTLHAKHSRVNAMIFAMYLKAGPMPTVPENEVKTMVKNT